MNKFTLPYVEFTWKQPPLESFLLVFQLKTTRIPVFFSHLEQAQFARFESDTLGLAWTVRIHFNQSNKRTSINGKATRFTTNPCPIRHDGKAPYLRSLPKSNFTQTGSYWYQNLPKLPSHTKDKLSRSHDAQSSAKLSLADLRICARTRRPEGGNSLTPLLTMNAIITGELTSCSCVI